MAPMQDWPENVGDWLDDKLRDTWVNSTPVVSVLCIVIFTLPVALLMAPLSFMLLSVLSLMTPKLLPYPWWTYFLLPLAMVTYIVIKNPPGHR